MYKITKLVRGKKVAYLAYLTILRIPGASSLGPLGTGLVLGLSVSDVRKV